MAHVTIQLIEGLERGQVLTDLPTPVTIGREDDNVIRLNDERVSRFHAKIQDDDGRAILTDLDSTNGTRVNGHPVQMRVLQFGDQISIGRCLLVFGSREEISERAAKLKQEGPTPSDPGEHTVTTPSNPPNILPDQSDALLEEQDCNVDEQGELFPCGPPEPPEGLRPFQKAEISDFLAFSHEQIQTVLQAAFEELNAQNEGTPMMCIGWPAWQRLLNLEMELAVYLRKIAEPEN